MTCIPCVPLALTAAERALLFTFAVRGTAAVANEGIIHLAESNGGETTSEGTRELGDLEPIHDPDHLQNDPNIGRLTDEEHGEAINNPADGEKVKVRGNSPVDSSNGEKVSRGEVNKDSSLLL